MAAMYINLRERLIDHIMTMKNLDPDYAREALKEYCTMLPDYDLMDGVRQAMRSA